jgi:hypothetical protein
MAFSQTKHGFPISKQTHRPSVLIFFAEIPIILAVLVNRILLKENAAEIKCLQISNNIPFQPRCVLNT